MKKCPIGKGGCENCPYQKESLCDYPYIGAEKVKMNNNNINHEGMWLKAKVLFPTCANHDKGLLELEEELQACCDSRGDGSPECGCWACPQREACEKLWGYASTQSSVRKLSLDEVARFKERFALIKGG